MASPGVDEALQQAREYARDVTRFSQRLHNLQQQVSLPWVQAGHACRRSELIPSAKT